MRFKKSFPKDDAQAVYDLKKTARKRKRLVRDMIFGLIMIGSVAGIGTCVHCRARKFGAEVDRTISDISDLSVVFINGEAALSWVDPPDIFLDHIEIVSGREPENIAQKTEKHVISGLENGKEYFFTVKAVDRWGNKSSSTKGGTGKALKQQGSIIKGTPVAEQVTLSWTNFADTEYDHIEITYDPDNKTPIRIPRGVESRTLARLTNGLEHTFSVMAVDAQSNRKFLNETGIFIPDHATSPESVLGRSSGGEITLAWQESFPLDYVEVVYSPEGEIPVTIARGAQTGTFTGLSDITDYEFTVYAVDTAGRRQPLKNVELSSPVIPVFDGRDAEKMEVRAKPVAGQIQFEWDDPEMDDLDHVAILYDPDGNNAPVTVDAGMKTRTLIGLSDDQEYRFLVYGVDSKSNNRVITGVTFSTPQLSRLEAKPVAGKVTLVWTDPWDPYLDHVEITCSPGGEIPVRVAKGIQAYAFTNLSDNQEYEFKVIAVNRRGNIYPVAQANAIVTSLPVLTGIPINRSVSLAWIDPADVAIDHIEIVYSPGGDRARSVARGIESYTFTNLAGNTEYTFTIYARDNADNRHPVRSARIYDPNTAFVFPSDSARQSGELGPLVWKSANNAAFGGSTVYALSFGIAANGATRWVAGGGEGRMAYSNDYGLNWIPVNDSTFGNFSVNTIGYGNGRWVAGGKSGKIAWSTNAMVWNAVKRTHFSNSQTINAIAFGNGRWIAGGSNGIMILSDDDGVTWRPITPNVFGKSAINAIVFYGGRWMAGGAAGKIAYSDDNGLAWTAVANSTFENSAVNVIVYDRNRWMAGGYAQRIAWSDDAVTWRPLARPFYILCMAFNGSRWVIGGQEGRMAWSGDGGESWKADETGHNFFDNNWVQAIASGMAPNGKRRWLSGGENGKIIYADEP